MDGKSLNLTAEKINQLRELFPEIFSEEKIDFARLKDILGESVAFPNEHYELSWAGKAEARKEIQKQTTNTLTPSPSPTGRGESDDNIFIEGENLEVLRILQKSYFGKIKMIYIDPPYNTGNDSFVYPDDYSERQDEYNKRAGITNEAGYLNKQDLWRKNTRENGQFHSVWLSMMYPRLYLARNLLREDGVIFVSIGNDEQANLKLLLDEIFGQENFVECITWNKRVPKNDKGIGNIHEHILIYAKQLTTKHVFKIGKHGLDDVFEFVEKLKRKKMGIADAEKEIKKFYDKQGYDRGITLYNSLDENYELWGKINLSWPNANTEGPRYDVLHPITKKPAKVPDRGWRWKEETFRDLLDYKNIKKLHDGSYVCGKIWFAEDEYTQPSLIQPLREVSDFLLRSVLSLKSDGGIVTEEILGRNIFPYPKPVDLIKTLLSSYIEDGEIALDFFAGSGTTAHAILELNEEENTNYKFMCVQMPELLEENSEAYKAGYRTIVDISKARINKVVEKIEKSRAEQLALESNRQTLKVGYFKIAPSNFKGWRGDVEGEELLKQLEIFQQSEKDGSLHQNMLVELLLKSGLPLTAKVETCEVSQTSQVYIIEDGKLFVFFGEYSKAIKAFIHEKKPQRVVCLDSAFKGKDEDISNFKLELKEAGIELSII